MLLLRKPYKSIETIENAIFSESDFISFEIERTQEKITATIASINTKGIVIQREGNINTENWNFFDIKEGSMRLA